MIDATAIDRIVELSKIDTPATGASVPEYLALPSTMHVVDLESYQACRRRFRGRYTTTSIRHFADYLAAADTGDLRVFVDAEKACATCVIDAGDVCEPGHCEHRAQLTLRPTAIWRAVMALDNHVFTQRSLAEWLEDWRNYLDAVSAEEELIPLARAIAAIRKIDITATAKSGSEVGNMSETRSALARIEASSVEGLPARINATFHPYPELQKRTVALDLHVISGETPKLKLRMLMREEVDEMIADEFAAHLEGALPDGAKAMVGTFTPG